MFPTLVPSANACRTLNPETHRRPSLIHDSNITYSRLCTGCREKVRVLVKDAVGAKAAYGPYVAPVAGDAGDPRAVAAALRGARAAIVTGRLGALLPAVQQAGLDHLVSCGR